MFMTGRYFFVLLALLVYSLDASAEGLIRGSINSGGSFKASIGVIGFGVKTITGGAMGVINKIRAPELNPELKLGEVYAFPNPAKRGKKPTIHVEVGVADSVKLRIYDIAGDLLHETEITSAPLIINDGHGKEYAYEYVWDGTIPSGTYICVVQASKKDKADLKATIKLAVIR
jgi:hypothetical protein